MTSRRRRGELWAIVLAAGEGSRLSDVTRAVHGRAVPKQFATLWGNRTFLERTLDRVTTLVPSCRTLIVVAEDCREMALEQTRHYPGVEIIYQPSNRGTGAGLLLPLAHILARDPEARVLVFPSDHHVEREAVFANAVRSTVAAIPSAPRGVVILGAGAESAATDLGWIDCGRRCGGAVAQARHVRTFVEKPGADAACELLSRGALWNTMVLATRGEALWQLANRHIPATGWLFATYRALLGHPEADGFLRDMYTHLPVTDFCRDVFQATDGLAVVPMIDAGWSDCGTPERLFRAIEKNKNDSPMRPQMEQPHFSPAQASRA